MTDRHITNLESNEKIAEAVALTDEQLAALGEDAPPQQIAIAQAAKVHAELRAENHIRTLALLASEYPGYEFGEPRATRMKTAAAIKADGIVGVYRAKGA